jgi:hypothetical protein
MRTPSHAELNSQRQGGANTRCFLGVVVMVAASVTAGGCTALGDALKTGSNPPPPASNVSVTVTPAIAAVLLGNSQTFTATVKDSDDTGVTWSVNGVLGGNATIGTISATGVYTAPADLPVNAAVQVTARSHADATKAANAGVTISSDVQISMPAASATVELGATQHFRASLSSGGHPDAAVRWSLSGGACPAACGSVDTNGNFTAPQVLPNPATATVTAQSVADPSKTAVAAITIASTFTVQISAPANVPVNSSAAISAVIAPAAGSNPAEGVIWSLSGSGCSGASCGSLTVLTQQSAGGGATANAATYHAPATVPGTGVVTLTATPEADASKRISATVTILPGGNVVVSPATATLAVNHRITLTAQVGGPSANVAAPGVTWSVNGIAGGNTSVGQVCVVGTNPCQPVTNGTAAQVDYVAPGAMPSPNPVTVQATNAADSTKSASAQITILNHVVVTVQPGTVTLAPLAVQGFAASVIGSTNQSVVWQVQGPACSRGGPGVCGSITQNGAYTAPNGEPAPNSVQVVAISQDDTSQSGSATVTISGGANILSLHPASVYAGAAAGFVLRVDGSGFVATTPGPGSSLVIGGVARTTTCSSAGECTAPVTAADVASPGGVSVQVSNPNGASSNVVSLIVAPPNASDEVISLTNAAPVAMAKDITVVEPTTAGVSMPGTDVDLNLAALGDFSTTNNSCSLAGNPVVLQRPASGGMTADICLFSESGLDVSMAFTVSGPGDIAVLSKQPLGLGIIRLTLQVPSTAAPGARTVFVQNANLDKAAASGSLIVE